MRRWFYTLAALLAVAIPAHARNADGTLGLIQTPNDGIPAIVAPGGAFDVNLSEKAAVKLSGPEPVPGLTIEWHTLPGGRALAHCTVAGNAQPGTYAVVATAGDTTDRNVRSVYVRTSFPPVYMIAHVTDIHIGSHSHKKPADEMFKEILTKVNASNAAFVALTGDLTDNGTLEQFRRFVEILDTCALPTFVCPGNHDRKALNYEHVFGPLTYMFRFGLDGYLCYDTKDYNIADDLGRQDADLQIYRRALKPCRWCIGLTHRYDPDQGMRSQLVLFVDNPLDYLIFGHWHRENTKDEVVVPWGTTRYTVTPAAKDGAYRYFDITPKEIHPRPVEMIPNGDEK